MDKLSSAQDLYQLASANQPGRTDEDTVVLTCIFNNIIYFKFDFFFLAETDNSPTNQNGLSQPSSKINFVLKRRKQVINNHLTQIFSLDHKSA